MENDVAHQDETKILSKISELGDIAIKRERSRARVSPRETGLSKIIRNAFEAISKMRENGVRWRIVASVLLQSGVPIPGIEAVSEQTLSGIFSREKRRRAHAENLTSAPSRAQKAHELLKVDGVERKGGDREGASAPIDQEPHRETGGGSLTEAPVCARGVIPVERAGGSSKSARKSVSIDSVMYGTPRRGDVVELQEVDPEEERLAILRVKWTWMHERLYYGGNIKQGDVLRGPPPEWDGTAVPCGVGKFPNKT